MGGVKVKSWLSISDAAQDLGINERQGWRWLKNGRLRKERGEDGQVVFALTNMSDTDVTDVSSDMAVMSPHDREEGGRDRGYVRGYPPVIGSIPKTGRRDLVSLNLIEYFFQLRSWFRNEAPLIIQLGNLLCVTPDSEDNMKILEQWRIRWSQVENWYLEIQSLNVEKERLRVFFNDLLEIQKFTTTHGFPWVLASDSGSETLDSEEQMRAEKMQKEERDKLSSIFQKIFENLRILISFEE